MKTILQIIIVAFLINSSISLIKAQNLVLNPSFEDTVFCPQGHEQINACQHWMNFGKTPDYYCICSPLGFIPPNLITGYQIPHTGSAMMGLIPYEWQFGPDWPNYREFIGSQLKTPLEIGQKYYMSFYVNCAGYLPEWQIIGSNKMGLRFSNHSYDATHLPSINNQATVFTNIILTDTVNWFKISGSFIADSVYTYIIIGSFFDDNNTDTIIFGGPSFGGSSSYYYIDDVCVSKDSIYNETWTGIKTETINNNNLQIFPNPTPSTLHIKSSAPIDYLEIINTLGEVVFIRNNINSQEFIVPEGSLKAGMYFVKVGAAKEIRVVKVCVVK